MNQEKFYKSDQIHTIMKYKKQILIGFTDQYSNQEITIQLKYKDLKKSIKEINQ